MDSLMYIPYRNVMASWYETLEWTLIRKMTLLGAFIVLIPHITPLWLINFIQSLWDFLRKMPSQRKMVNFLFPAILANLVYHYDESFLKFGFESDLGHKMDMAFQLFCRIMTVTLLTCNLTQLDEKAALSYDYPLYEPIAVLRNSPYKKDLIQLWISVIIVGSVHHYCVKGICCWYLVKVLGTWFRLWWVQQASRNRRNNNGVNNQPQVRQQVNDSPFDFTDDDDSDDEYNSIWAVDTDDEPNIEGRIVPRQAYGLAEGEEESEFDNVVNDGNNNRSPLVALAD